MFGLYLSILVTKLETKLLACQQLVQETLSWILRISALTMFFVSSKPLQQNQNITRLPAKNPFFN